MPIKQFFYFDALECLPKNVISNQSSEDAITQSIFELSKMSRYYSQEIIFGKDFQERLGKCKYFLVKCSIHHYKILDLNVLGGCWCHWV